ncbi:MAG: hypothetical protein Q8L48_01195 [Archangium sp.]|nr:hypothetical protein [Archangium sp.]
MRKLVLLGLVFAACRTEIKPLVRGEAAARGPRLRNAECQMRDYPGATDVPAGAKSLGWVKIDRLANDEATFEALRKKVCEMGGDAISQMHWIRASGASVADPPVELEGNVWSLP